MITAKMNETGEIVTGGPAIRALAAKTATLVRDAKQRAIANPTMQIRDRA
jgi:hypothetical protein